MSGEYEAKRERRRRIVKGLMAIPGVLRCALSVCLRCTESSETTPSPLRTSRNSTPPFHSS